MDNFGRGVTAVAGGEGSWITADECSLGDGGMLATAGVGLERAGVAGTVCGGS